jgi:hypothetical protein
LAIDTAHGKMDQVLGPDVFKATVWTADGLRHRAIQIARVRLSGDMPQDADLGLLSLQPKLQLLPHHWSLRFSVPASHPKTLAGFETRNTAFQRISSR